MRRFVLIDGHAVLHRAYHAFPKTLTTRRGELVNAVYGFTRILLSVLKDLNPEYCAVAFDLPLPTFRHKEFIGYQMKRPAMDKELKDQIERVKQVLEALGIPYFAVPGYEADDIIGTLAYRVTKKAFGTKSRRGEADKDKEKKIAAEVIIVTGDRDIMQIADKNIKIYFLRRGGTEAEIFDAAGVRNFLGIRPAQVADYKGLAGDASDNYPGVAGIGPKTAVELIDKYGSLEEIYRQISKIGDPRLKEKLVAGRESAFLSKKLATIATDVPVKFNLSSCRVADYDREKALEVLKELEFHSLMDKLPGGGEDENKKEQNKSKQMELFGV